MPPFLAFDVGATNTRAAVADAEGTVLGRRDRFTPNGADVDGAAVAEAVRSAGLGACRAAGIEPAAVEGVAVATVAEIDRDRGVVVDPANLPVDFVPLAAALSAFADDVLLCNDATAGALGARASADGDLDDLVYLSISTGIGAGVLAGGRALEGHRGNAGEVGHIALDPASRVPCGCGGEGHWETYCSGEGIPRYARHLAEEESLDTALPIDDLDAADVFAAVGDDPLADLVVERVADWNARGVAAIVHAYDPAVVTIGGAVALENPDLVVDPIRDRLTEFVHVGPVPEVRLTEVGGDVVLRGAVELAVAGWP